MAPLLTLATYMSLEQALRGPHDTALQELGRFWNRESSVMLLMLLRRTLSRGYDLDVVGERLLRPRREARPRRDRLDGADNDDDREDDAVDAGGADVQSTSAQPHAGSVTVFATVLPQHVKYFA